MGADCDPENMVAVGDVLYFTADDGIHGREVWQTDGTEGGTWMVKDIRAGQDTSSPSNLVSFDGLLYFAANEGTNGTELWRSDGAEVGTWMVRDIQKGAASSSPAQLTVVGNTLFFVVSNGRTLWKSDGTEAGTAFVSNLEGTIDPHLQGLTAVVDRLFFFADDTTHGLELWQTDGTTVGTHLVRDIYTGTPDSVDADVLRTIELAGNLFFTADDDGYGLGRQPCVLRCR